jgi:hypothetical protein
LEGEEVTAETPGIVDSLAEKPFWVRWSEDGLLEVGDGMLTSPPFMEYRPSKDHRHPVNAISMTTHGQNASGTWDFRINDCESTVLVSISPNTITMAMG